MAYLMMILEPADGRRSRTLEEGHIAYDRMLAYTEDLRKRGVCKVSDSLGPDSKGVRIEVRGGKRKLVDGPFAESKEIIGGFFLLECDTKEEAVAIASECPAAEWATLEVRSVGPCWDAG